MNEWELLEIAPTEDVKSVKRAYAKKIKTIDPSTEPECFQQVREAYEYLLDYGIHYVGDEEVDENDSPDDDFGSTALENSEIESREFENTEVQHAEVKNIVLDPPIFNQTNLSEEVEAHTNQVNSECFDPDEIADKFIQDLHNLYENYDSMELHQWVSILNGDELQYLEVNDLLRFQIFGFFLGKLEDVVDAKDSLAMLINKLPRGMDDIIKYYADYFDWKNTELLLSRYYDHKQMQLLTMFYTEAVKHDAVTTPTKKENKMGVFFIWISLFLLMKFVRTFFE